MLKSFEVIFLFTNTKSGGKFCLLPLKQSIVEQKVKPFLHPCILNDTKKPQIWLLFHTMGKPFAPKNQYNRPQYWISKISTYAETLNV